MTDVTLFFSKASMVLPTMPLIRLMRSEAVEHLEAGRLERAALNLFQFQSISLRHQAIFQVCLTYSMTHFLKRVVTSNQIWAVKVKYA